MDSMTFYPRYAMLAR